MRPIIRLENENKVGSMSTSPVSHSPPHPPVHRAPPAKPAERTEAPAKHSPPPAKKSTVDVNA
jgi:hypothetical protein